MKKKITMILGGVALGLFTLFNIHVNKANGNEVALSTVANTATAQGESPLQACNSWCRNGSYCSLLTSAGYTISCYGWDQP